MQRSYERLKSQEMMMSDIKGTRNDDVRIEGNNDVRDSILSSLAAVPVNLEHDFR